jgi:hypothetical protein
MSLDLGVASAFSFFREMPILFLQFFSIQELIFQWEAFGVFDFILPFLLIFALVFGILINTRILGGHKGVNLIIALVIALMALRFGIVQVFFSELFPRFAVGLTILITIAILAGLFIHNKAIKGWFIGLSILGVVIGIGVLIATFNTLYWFNSFFWVQNWPAIVGGILLVLVIVAIFVGAGPKPTSQEWGPLQPLRDAFVGR